MMIVKIQIARHTSDASSRCLIYNKSRDFMVEQPLVPLIADMMKGRPKAYFKVVEPEEFARHGLTFDGEVEEQDW